MKAGSSSWSEADDNLLVALWNDGKKSSEIAGRLRRSKNAVVGRAHRLQKMGRIVARANPVKGGVKRVTLPKTEAQLKAARIAGLKEVMARRAAAASLPAEKMSMPLPVLPEPPGAPKPPPPPPPPREPPTIPKVPPTRHRCVFPLWGDKGRADPNYLRYCDAPTRAAEDGGGVYCAEHAALCFTRITAHRDRSVLGLLKVAAKEKATVAAPEGDPQELGMEAA